MVAAPLPSPNCSSRPATQPSGRSSALSERETGPAADNLVSNEDSYPRVAAEVARSCPPGHVYLGVGPDQNFTLLARRSPASHS